MYNNEVMIKLYNNVTCNATKLVLCVGKKERQLMFTDATILRHFQYTIYCKIAVFLSHG